MNEIKYPFYDFIMEDKSGYPTATSAGFVDPDNDFLIGESGGFLMNIIPGAKFVNTHLLTPMADYFRRNKNFTNYKIDSIPHIQLRKREEARRRNGFTARCLKLPDGRVVDVHITGSHYNFINYTLMEQLNEKTIAVTSGNNRAEKIQDFSKFIDAQYWTFKIMEFIDNNGFHLIIDKTRRGGFSYIMAADTANYVNLNPKKVCIHVATLSNYLTDAGGLSDFAINNLNFFEDKTPFVRGVYSKVKSEFKLGMRQKDGREHPDSWRSALLSVSANNNPNCAIGKDAKKIKVEEVSTMTNFDEFMEVTAPAMRTGSFVTGNLICWGTATAGDMQVFERNFYSPKANKFMPFENVWDNDARNSVCGYFKPYCWGLQGIVDGKPAMDEDGNSDIMLGLRIAEQERAEKKINAKTYTEYINYLGQYANQPCESFSSSSENIFSSEELTAYEADLRVNDKYKIYVDGMLVEEDNKIIFKSNERLLKEGGKLNVNVFDYIAHVPRKTEENPHGCIRRFFPPIYEDIYNDQGRVVREIPKDLYSITYDPVGINKDKKEITNRHSHNSIYVWENPHPMNGYNQRLVAVYYGRPDTLEEADRICYYLAVYYNCISSVAVEVDRGETISNFTKWRALRYIQKEPTYIWDTSVKGTQSEHYGYIIGDGGKKLTGLRLLKEMLYTKIGVDKDGNDILMFTKILDYQTILELKKWNNLGNYDRVSSLILRGIQFSAMDFKAKKLLNARQKIDDSSSDNSHTNIFKRDWF